MPLERASAFASSFLRILVTEERLGRTLPDPHWTHSNDQFDAEVGQLRQQTVGYRYDAEAASHKLLSEWLDRRRLAGSKVARDR
jgi:hypothetical protein